MGFKYPDKFQSESNTLWCSAQYNKIRTWSF